MNEAETRAELIDPLLRAAGWGVTEGSRVLRERDVCRITRGRIRPGGGRERPLIADYILEYKGVRLAVVEAKSDELPAGEGVAQAKLYAARLDVPFAYATNGREIYGITMKKGEEGPVERFPTPDELWEAVTTAAGEDAGAEEAQAWYERFMAVPFEDRSGTWQLRYYQEVAVRRVMEAIARGRDRILLTLATGTGKTAIAFQITWKLFHARWTLKRDGRRRPRILFLADRNILADQAYNAFSAFPEDALVRIRPGEIRRRGRVPVNGSIFFTIYQTFMSGTDREGRPTPYFGEYPPDYFDFIIIDECHRGGADDESRWRSILEYFSPAVQLGLTATPKRKDNVDTYRYFGEPVYVYSLKEGINDGFLTPFRVKRIKTTLDDYIYTGEDDVIEGEIEEGRLYTEPDFNRIIEIKEREAKRVRIFMDDIGPDEKTIVFCATQDHAAAVRDLVNQYSKSSDPLYCVRVTANDGELGEQYLRAFRDNEKTIPTILTTSQKLSTGVDARNIRNIVLMRPVNTMIEFKQIIGRGTRLFEGKEYFTIYDFVDAYHHFSDPEWDGEPVPPVDQPGGKRPVAGVNEDGGTYKPEERRRKIRVRLRDGKEREIQHMVATSFWSADGRPITAEQFLENLFGELPRLFRDEEELRRIWSNPVTRRTLLERLDEAGFGRKDLETLQKLINAEKSDLFDVLEYVFDSDKQPVTRAERATRARSVVFAMLDEKQREFIDFVLDKYVEAGVGELDQEKLPILLQTKYQSLEDALAVLGDVEEISSLFSDFQKYLYDTRVA